MNRNSQSLPKSIHIIYVFLVIALGFTLIAEIGNLIGFGTQEAYLQHPDYPEGEQYKKDVESK